MINLVLVWTLLLELIGKSHVLRAFQLLFLVESNLVLVEGGQAAMLDVGQVLDKLVLLGRHFIIIRLKLE